MVGLTYSSFFKRYYKSYDKTKRNRKVAYKKNIIYKIQIILLLFKYSFVRSELIHKWIIYVFHISYTIVNLYQWIISKVNKSMGLFLRFVISNVFDILQVLILIRVFISWVPHDTNGKLIILLYSVTESILRPIRDSFPLVSNGFDISPVIAFFLIGFIKKLLLFAV